MDIYAEITSHLCDNDQGFSVQCNLQFTQEISLGERNVSQVPQFQRIKILSFYVQEN